MSKRPKIDFTYGAVFAAALMLVCGYSEIMIPMLFAALIHEVGHLTAIIATGGQVRSIIINAGGLKIDYDSSELSYFRDALCTLSGPIFGIASAYISSYFNKPLLSGICFGINMFNLIPVRPLDGGRLLWQIMMSIVPNYADGICGIVEYTVLCGLILRLVSEIFLWDLLRQF